MSDSIVLKFGGASVAQPESFQFISEIISYRLKTFSKIAVVVSAMGNTTDELIKLAHQVNEKPPQRELDMLISVGERMSIALLAMALDKIKIKAVSFTGSQSGIITTSDHSHAKIIDVKPKRLIPHLSNGYVVIVAGFQGMSTSGEITTLGRGGSDTTAVALASALNSSCVEFYKDVNGIYDCDPKLNKNAKRYSNLSYKEAYQLTFSGAKILHHRCIAMAEKNALPLHVKPFADYKNQNSGTLIFSPGEKPAEPIYES